MSTLTETFENIAEAINAKGVTGSMTPSEMPSKIANIGNSSIYGYTPNANCSTSFDNKISCKVKDGVYEFSICIKLASNLSTWTTKAIVDAKPSEITEHLHFNYTDYTSSNKPFTIQIDGGIISVQNKGYSTIYSSEVICAKFFVVGADEDHITTHTVGTSSIFESGKLTNGGWVRIAENSVACSVDFWIKLASSSYVNQKVATVPNAEIVTFCKASTDSGQYLDFLRINGNELSFAYSSAGWVIGGFSYYKSNS